MTRIYKWWMLILDIRKIMPKQRDAQFSAKQADKSAQQFHSICYFLTYHLGNFVLFLWKFTQIIIIPYMILLEGSVKGSNKIKAREVKPDIHYIQASVRDNKLRHALSPLWILFKFRGLHHGWLTTNIKLIVYT